MRYRVFLPRRTKGRQTFNRQDLRGCNTGSSNWLCRMAASEIDALLARPLTVDDAAQIALLNNRGLQALYYNLGIAEADLVQAGRLQNPRFSTTRTRSAEDFKYETALTINAINLLTMPLALKLERGRFEAVQREVADEVLKLGLETRRAWYRAVAAEESARYYEQVLEATGLKVQRIFKLQEGRPNALDLLKNREIQLLINTPAGPTHERPARSSPGSARSEASAR